MYVRVLCETVYCKKVNYDRSKLFNNIFVIVNINEITNISLNINLYSDLDASHTENVLHKFL